MLKKIIQVFFILNIVFLYFCFSRPIFAQGSCTADRLVNRCHLAVNNCEGGYSPRITSELFAGQLICHCTCFEGGITNPLITDRLAQLSGVEFLNKFIGLAISLGFIIAAIVFFFMFISGGIRWITSAGDKGKVEAARGQITHAIIGLLLTFALYVILGLIEDFFGLSLRQFNLPKLTD